MRFSASLSALLLTGCIGASGQVTPQGADESTVVLAVPLDRPYSFVSPQAKDNPRLAAAGAFLRGQVVSVQDGQTFTAIINERTETVRLIGLDAPPLGRVPWGGQARDVLKALIAGRSVRLETEATLRDGKQGILAYVYAGDLFVNLEMVRQGMAQLSKTVPPTSHDKIFRAAEEQARKEGLGVWGPDYPPDDATIDTPK